MGAKNTTPINLSRRNKIHHNSALNGVFTFLSRLDQKSLLLHRSSCSRYSVTHLVHAVHLIYTVHLVHTVHTACTMKFWRHVLILLLSLLIFPTEGRHQHGNRQSSSGNPPNRGDKESKVVKLSPEILMPDPTTIDKLPECQRICNGAFSNAIRAALEASNHRDRFVDVCR